MQVILAERKSTRQMCAIKIVNKRDILKEDTAEASLLERDVLALGDWCRFITGLFAAFQTTERLFFVMEFVSGGDLFHHIAKVTVHKFSAFMSPDWFLPRVYGKILHSRDCACSPVFARGGEKLLQGADFIFSHTRALCTEI